MKCYLNKNYNVNQPEVKLPKRANFVPINGIYNASILQICILKKNTNLRNFEKP